MLNVFVPVGFFSRSSCFVNRKCYRKRKTSQSLVLKWNEMKSEKMGKIHFNVNQFFPSSFIIHFHIWCGFLPEDETFVMLFWFLVRRSDSMSNGSDALVWALIVSFFFLFLLPFVHGPPIKQNIQRSIR